MAKSKLILLFFSIVFGVAIGVISSIYNPLPLFIFSTFTVIILLSGIPTERHSNSRIIAFYMSLLFLPSAWIFYLSL